MYEFSVNPYLRLTTSNLSVKFSNIASPKPVDPARIFRFITYVRNGITEKSEGSFLTSLLFLHRPLSIHPHPLDTILR